MNQQIATTSDTGPLTANERRIIAFTSVGHALCHISELVFAAVLGALMREFQLAPDEVTRLAVPGFMLFGLGAVPAGLWTDHRGSREVLTVYFFLLAAACVAVATVRTPWSLGVALTMLGAAISLYHPAALAMLSHGCRRRGQAMGINGVAGSIGVATGPFLGLCMVSFGEWRWAYWLIAGVSLLSGIAALLVRMQAERPAQAPLATAVSSVQPMRLGLIGLLFGAMLLGGLNYRCMTTALPSLLSGETSTPPTKNAPRRSVATTSDAEPRAAAAGLVAPGAISKAGLVFLVFVMGSVGQYAGGQAADKRQPARAYTLLILLTVPAALAVASGSTSTMWLPAIALSVFLFAQQPVENTLVAQITSARWRSTMYGLKFVLSFGLGAFGAQLTGIVWKHYGLASLFNLFALLALLMAIFAAAFWARWASLHGSRPANGAALSGGGGS